MGIRRQARALLQRTLLIAALAGVPGLPAAAAGDAAEAQDAIFGHAHLENITAPGTLQYTYERTGALLPALVDQVEVEITEVRPDGRKAVALRLFTGPGRRELEPAQGFRSNPLIVTFLQRDVEQMSRMTGGSAQYFRTRIRAAFNDPAAVRTEPFEVPFEQRRLAATKVTIEPFRHDPNLARFPEYALKRYEFVLAEELPGGVSSLRAVTPGPSGEPILDERLSYRGQE